MRVRRKGGRVRKGFESCARGGCLNDDSVRSISWSW